MTGVSPDLAEPPLTLVLDLGSSSLRGAIHDGRARPIDAWDVRDPHPLHVTADGGVEEDAGEVVGRTADVIDRLLDAAGDRAREITAAGMAVYAPTLVGVGADGLAVTPVYTYADARPVADVHRLRGAMDERAVHQRTGCRLHTSYWPARLIWLKRTDPDRYRRAHQWMSLPDYIYGRLLGRFRSAYSTASWTGLLNRHTSDWDSQWLADLGLHRSQLPELSDAPLHGLAPEYARRWPCLKDAVWIPGQADGAMSTIGSDCRGPDSAALSLGTSGALRLVLPAQPEVIPAGLWCYLVDRGRPLLGGALNDAGSLMEWVRDTTRLDDLEAAEHQLSVAEPDGHGLTVLPFLTGERSTGWQPDIRATLHGVGIRTSPMDILQACMEAVAYRFGRIWQEMIRMGGPAPERVVAGGGGASSTPWLQTIADVLNVPVAVPVDVETTGRGVAIVALQEQGVTGVAAPAIDRWLQPDTVRHARYAAGMDRQQRLYDRLANW